MEDHVKLLCQELVAELAEAAIDNSEMSPAPVGSFLQANIVGQGDVQTPPTTDRIAAGPTPLSPTIHQSALPEPRTEPLKPQFFAKRPAAASLPLQAKVKIWLRCRILFREQLICRIFLSEQFKSVFTSRWREESVRVQA